jgi:broad specificity phosphatase PhoE
VILYLVRHAKATPRRDWSGTDIDRPLDDKGFRQAPEICAWLRKKCRDAAKPPLLFSSPSVRCRQTLEPLADALNVKLRDDALLGDLDSGEALPSEDPDEIIAWLGRQGMRFIDREAAVHPDRVVVACSHGDVLPETLALLFDRDDVSPDDSGNAKGSVWMLHFDDGRCTGAAYRPAP